MDDRLTPAAQDTALLVILRVMRRKKMLKPADLTDLRVALMHNRGVENVKDKLLRLLEETWLEKEEKKDTPGA